MWEYTCMYIYVYIRAHILQVYYTHAYTHINSDDRISKYNNNSAKYIIFSQKRFSKTEFQKLTVLLD